MWLYTAHVVRPVFTLEYLHVVYCKRPVCKSEGLNSVVGFFFNQLICVLFLSFNTFPFLQLIESLFYFFNCLNADIYVTGEIAVKGKKF